MKKLFLSFAILFAASTVLVSCGNDKKDGSGDATPAADSKKSTCDCMKLAAEEMKKNPETFEVPAGCEWLDKASEEEIEKAMKDCPESIKGIGREMGTDDGAMDDMEGMEGMDDMDMGGDMDMDMEIPTDPEVE